MRESVVADSAKKKARTYNGLFTEFEYIPSRYSLADELATKVTKQQ